MSEGNYVPVILKTNENYDNIKETTGNVTIK